MMGSVEVRNREHIHSITITAIAGGRRSLLACPRALIVLFLILRVTSVKQRMGGGGGGGLGGHQGGHVVVVDEGGQPAAARTGAPDGRGRLCAVAVGRP